MYVCAARNSEELGCVFLRVSLMWAVLLASTRQSVRVPLRQIYGSGGGGRAGRPFDRGTLVFHRKPFKVK